MSETTNLNSELLSADARGRKHVPFAVFAVILVHIVLFLVLLIAAGCRAKARARLKKNSPAVEMLAQTPPASVVPASVPTLSTNYSQTLGVAPAAITPALIQPVVATEPPIDKRPAPPAPRKAAQKEAPKAAQRPTAAANTHKPKVYVVKAGDTVEKIAKMHGTSVEAIKSENNLKSQILRPGQQLRVSSQKTKAANQV
jgi:LysM repeat protein